MILRSSNWPRKFWACNQTSCNSSGGGEAFQTSYDAAASPLPQKGVFIVNNILRQWNRLEQFLFGFLALAALAVAFYGVFMRYIFDAPPHWNEELSIYLIIWSVFITASTLAAENGHVAATLLVEHFPVPVRRALAVVTKLLILGFCSVITWNGFLMVLDSYLMDQRSPTALRFPFWIAYLSVTTGCFLICLRSIIQIYRLIFRFQKTDILEGHEMSRERVQP